MHIFATCFQAITVQRNCYANFALIKGQCEASFFRVHFQAAVIRTCSLCQMKKKNLRLQPIKRRVSLVWKPNWLPYHHVLKLWLTSLTPGRALDQLCHRIQTSKKIFRQRKTWTCSTQQKVSSVFRTKRLIFPTGTFLRTVRAAVLKVHDEVAERIDNACTKRKWPNTFVSRTVNILKVPIGLTSSYGTAF